MIEVFIKYSNIYIMLYSSKYQIMKYFLATLCQNIIPQKKKKKEKMKISKTFNDL